ncbi:type II secretion system protein [Paenibacillus ihuae]|uniref:type II secretion system protein n=1 Tax=Paenibacillus ihuae TaxID=1232431 RepID=UPI0006D5A30C|nr:prepilin-type N-terminal cleavage/methylation domain-containing protein [Paenibacillus ihuae]
MLAQAIKKRLSKEENQKGFTLIELLAVIVILGIIAVIAIPMIGGIINNTKEDADVATARQVYDAARMLITAERNGAFDSNTAATGTTDTVTIAQLQAGNYLEATLLLPSDKNPITAGTVTFTDGVLSALSLSSTATTTGAVAVPHTFVVADVLKSSK